MSLDPCRPLARAGAAAAAVVAVLALVGWATGFALLTSGIAGTASMKVNTALCMVVLGGKTAWSVAAALEEMSSSAAASPSRRPPTRS